MTMAEYIDREALETALNNRLNFLMDENGEYDHYTSGFDEAVTIVEDLPSADVAQVVHGRWIEKSSPARKIYFECSQCGAQENKHTAIKGYYCWRCGAKMDEKEAVYD